MSSSATTTSIKSFSSSTSQGPPFDAQKRAECVRRVKQCEHWQSATSDVVEREFGRSKLILMVDDRPAMRPDSFRQNAETGRWELVGAPRLAMFDSKDLAERLLPYGLAVGTLNSCLLDVWGPAGDGRDGEHTALFGTSLRLESPPPASGIPANGFQRELEAALGVRLMELRLAMLTMEGEEEPREREWLARCQSIFHWFWLYRNCPQCCTPLEFNAAKSKANCLKPDCLEAFYPNVSPAVIALIRDESDTHALLVQHHRSVAQVFTCISGFCSPGETLEQTVRREVAEEVGLHCWDVRKLGGSQSWPIPNSSLMIPFLATACRQDRVVVQPSELDNAQWFSREEIGKAFERVEGINLFRELQVRREAGHGLDLEARRILRYIPPKGAIAHRIIKAWLEGGESSKL